MVMNQLTPQEFLTGVEEGYITEVFSVGRRVYGKDPRGMADTGKQYQVVWADIP
jgi:hypothetical protein